MKTITKNRYGVWALAALAIAATACNKEESANRATQGTGSVQSAVASTQSIAVAAADGTDSVYVVNTCGPRQHRDSVAISSLPASIGTYLTTNYAGYAGERAFAVKDQAGTVQGWVVIVQYNGKPVGLKFDASGNFVQVLEQREGHDLNGSGWHRGGRFDDRDGLRRDTVALSALPAAVTGYLATNYATDTLVRAFKGKDSGYVVLSLNNGAFATVFDASGNFVKRVQLVAKGSKPGSVDQAALPANVLSYLSTTYPGYVFKHAFKITANGTVQGYVVLIDANNTKYAVEFDAAGNFKAAKTVR
ncbi:MAG: PepSY-like domain-containing protein [Williamsia sp.]|nr:PepSY-like domain-containing protein [Williamsia sp.]